MMNPLLRRAYSIPAEIREDVADVIDRTKTNIRFSDTDIRYLFNVFNRYLNNSEPQKPDCPACVTNVVSKLRLIVDLWSEHGMYQDQHEESEILE